MRSLIRGYTLEAGVRRLQRTIGKVVRKSAVEMIDRKHRYRHGDAGKARKVPRRAALPL